MIRHAAQPRAPDPAPAVRGHDHQVDAQFAHVLRELGAGLSSQRHRGGQPCAALTQSGLDAAEVAPLGLPGRELDGYEEFCGDRVHRSGRQLVHEDQAQLAAAPLGDRRCQRHRLLGER